MVVYVLGGKEGEKSREHGLPASLDRSRILLMVPALQDPLVGVVFSLGLHTSPGLHSINRGWIRPGMVYTVQAGECDEGEEANSIPGDLGMWAIFLSF